jgi:hypothetical protein
MGFDYYIIKELRINFIYENSEHHITEELAVKGMYVKDKELENIDSDDEYHYIKFLQSRQNQMEKHKYIRDIVRDESYVNQNLYNKYNNNIKNIIERNFNYSDIKLIKVQKCQYTRER